MHRGTEVFSPGRGVFFCVSESMTQSILSLTINCDKVPGEKYCIIKDTPLTCLRITSFKFVSVPFSFLQFYSLASYIFYYCILTALFI